MTQSLSDSENAATVVIFHKIKKGQEKNYEAWLSKIIVIAKSFPGHLGASVINPVAGASVTYTILIRYDTRENLLGWINSDTRKMLIDEVQPLLAENDKFEVKSGLDVWFTPEPAKTKTPIPWRQFLVTWSAAFPIAVCLSYLIDVIINYSQAPLPPVLRIFFLTLCAALFTVYIVMPRYTRLVHKWLFNDH